MGFDIDPIKVSKLNSGQTYIGHIPSSKIQHVRSKHSSTTTDFSCLAAMDAV